MAAGRPCGFEHTAQSGSSKARSPGRGFAPALVRSGRGEGEDEAYGDVDVNCPFRPGLIWEWASVLRFLVLFCFVLGGCNGEEGWWELVLGG